jgi:hypothetical protein
MGQIYVDESPTMSVGESHIDPHELDVAVSVFASVFVSATGFNSDCEGSLHSQVRI